MREYVRSRSVDCGEYVRVNNFPVHRPSRKRAPKAKPTTEVQERLNAENSRNRLTDLIHANFTPDDTALHLTYRDGCIPEDVAGAMRAVYNYMRRMKRLWALRTGRDGKEFKYIMVTEETSTGRLHHHCLISGGLTMEELSDKWSMGHTQVKPLEFDETGLIGLATYITKSRLAYRRWTASKNLSEPAVREHDTKIRQKDVRYITENPEDVWFIEQLHPGYGVCPGSVKVEHEGLGSGYFISYMLYRKDNGYFWRDKFNAVRQKRRRAGGHGK